MTIKTNGGVFGRNPTFYNVNVDGKLTGGALRGSSLGIGVDSLSYLAEFAKASGNTYVMVNQTGASPSAILLGAEGTKNSVYSMTGPGNFTGKDLYLYRGSSLVFNTTSANNIAFPSGQGIDFSATAGTGTSELFKDYEEGTWTPTLVGSTSGSIPYSTTAFAVYTKIGRTVKVSAYLAGINVSLSTVVGDVRIGNFPYSALSGVGNGILQVSFCNILTPDVGDIPIQGVIEGNYVDMRKGSSTGTYAAADLNTGVTGGVMMFNIIYETGA